jgi:hypothetical protein
LYVILKKVIPTQEATKKQGIGPAKDSNQVPPKYDRVVVSTTLKHLQKVLRFSDV